MDLTPDAQNKRISIQFTDEEWNIVRHLSKVYGSSFLKLRLEEVFAQRRAQRRSVRQETLFTWFEGLTPAQQNQFLTNQGINFNDE